jgi:hypothetical protein
MEQPARAVQPMAAVAVHTLRAAVVFGVGAAGVRVLPEIARLTAF